MRKSLILIVAVLLVGGIASVWAGGAGEGAAPAEGDLIEVSLLQRQDPFAVGDFSTKGLHQVIVDRFNIDVKARLMANEPFREQFKLIIAAGDMTDFLAGVSRTTVDELNSWGTDGLLYAVDTLSHATPELNKYWANNPESKEFFTAPDGHIYNVPGGFDSPIFYHGTAVRKDMLDQVGFDVSRVQSFDDYVDMYRALKRANDGKPVMSTRSGIGGLLALPMKAVGLDEPMAYDDSSGEWFFAYTSDDARYAINWVRTLYSEGILHPDALTMGEDEWEPAMGELEYPAMFHDCVFCFAYNNVERKKREDPSITAEFVALQPPTYEGQLQPWRNRRVGGLEVILNADLPQWKAERIMVMLDWFRSDEGHITSRMGIEGEDWVMLDGLPRLLYAVPGNEYPFPSEWQGKIKTAEQHSEWSDNWGYIKFTGDMAEKAFWLGGQHLKDPSTNMFLNDYIPKYEPVYDAPPLPVVNFTEEENERVLSLRNALTTAAEEMAAKMIVGQVPMSGWSDLQTQLKSIGVGELEQIYNTAHQRSN